MRKAIQELAGLNQSKSLEQAASSAGILFKLNELLARKPLSAEQVAGYIIDEVPERHDAAHDSVKREVVAALVLGAALPDGMPGALRLRTHRFIRGGWKFFRCVDPKCGHLYPKGEEYCKCGKRTAPLYICRSCGADTLRFRGAHDDPSKAPLLPDDARGNEDEWVLYNLARIEEMSEGGPRTGHRPHHAEARCRQRLV